MKITVGGHGLSVNCATRRQKAMTGDATVAFNQNVKGREELFSFFMVN